MKHLGNIKDMWIFKITGKNIYNKIITKELTFEANQGFNAILKLKFL